MQSSSRTCMGITPRGLLTSSSTSDQVEKLAQGADIIVHSAFHPVMGPDQESGFPPLAFYRQSLASDLGAMAKRVGAKHLMLTHLGPSLGAVSPSPSRRDRGCRPTPRGRTSRAAA